jgi:DNA-binding NtrC family response regulator
MTHRTPDLFVGESAAIARLRRVIERVAPTRLPVLIEGPTGAGKELVAQALHAASGRSGSLVAFNVCAIADTMFEASIFGHVKGAFSGALRNHAGYLAEAHRGTLFLDEIGSLPMQSQAKLLRAVETQQFRPVGASTEHTSDFRLVAATNESLLAQEGRGTFRTDLRCRLSGCTIVVPPLSSRLDDIPLLIQHFAKLTASRNGVAVEFTREAISLLQTLEWPGNVRELKYMIECSIAFASASTVGKEDVKAILAAASVGSTHPSETSERRELLAILESTSWDTSLVARELGVHRVSVYRRMKKLGIDTRAPSAQRTSRPSKALDLASEVRSVSEQSNGAA